MKNTRIFLAVLLSAILLSGCMYPKENLSQNTVPYKEQLETVQKAVDQFQDANGGILPIKTKDAKTPVYQKYPVDFQKISPLYMPEPPGNAFESGGIFQYVIIDAETDPTVKLLDLRMADAIRELNLRIKSHKYPPFKDQLAKNVFTLDYKKLGYKEEPVSVSPFTNQNLPFVIDGQGDIYVDYRSDLYQKMQKLKTDLKPGEDIRHILVGDSMFVPAYSLPYTIDPSGNEPIFLEN
ncbi:hypothetical protein [Bacillus sp. T33-2]|uniref:hypothetical protein n=1 Tax=Bacillus sp. T33-2 TaxID=2054168 RepID=UPI000C78F6B5|nr:hypothetical protein [Bacillus sp. T33-2]PLR99753.1 hypothetical protein CVD19_01465 [Bacillus sp. T33-2]